MILKSIALAANISGPWILRFGRKKMQRSNQCLMVLVVTGLSLFILPEITSANPVKEELRANKFFPIELDTGDLLAYQGPNHGLTINGPATVEWLWEDGELFMKTTTETVRIRPLEKFPHEEMTEEMIAILKASHDDVPFIDNYLLGNTNPSDQEWAEAFEAWGNACSVFTDDLKTQFKNDRRDISVVASDLKKRANLHDLVVAGSARAEWLPDEKQIDLWLVLKGMPNHPDGTPDEVILILNRDRHEPAPLPTRITRKDALVLHHGINTLFESSKGPLVIKLGKGLFVSTSEGR